MEYKQWQHQFLSSNAQDFIEDMVVRFPRIILSEIPEQ